MPACSLLAVHRAICQARVALERIDGLVFMIGHGAQQWLNPRLRTPLRPVPHALAIRAVENASARAWCARTTVATAERWRN
jgi:hypothetical protein